MNLNRAFLRSFLAVSTLLLAGFAQATPITGVANIAGNVNVSRTSIAFAPTFESTSANETGGFSGLLGGTIKSLSGGPDTGNTFVPAFVSFTTGLATPVYFDLTYIAPGVGTLAGCNSSALGAICTLTGSPFSLFQLSSNTVIAALQLSGTLYTGSAATGTAPGVSIFSTQTSFNGTIPQIVAMLNNGQTLMGITYAATFQANPVVPEPRSLGLLGIGLMGAGLIARRKFIA